MNQTNTTPKDFFLHLGATIALYASAIALINLSFSIINYCFPDVLSGYFYSSSIAWPISMLIVLVPILYVLEWLIKKDIVMIPGKNEIWIQRWRIYLTLFLTGVVIAGDLITLINTYLNGEISIRFVYKFFVILIVLAIIFTYYILEKINKAQKTKTVLIYLGIIIVLIAIVSGFIVVGSPGKQRAIRFDSQRVSDLQNIQWQIVSHWQQKGKLPNSLEDIKDSISYRSIPVDPENNSSYEYIAKDPMKFSLCSSFSLDSQDNKGRGDYGYGGGMMTSPKMMYPIIGSDDNWNHKSGHTCFERTIDPEKYPILPKN